MLPPFPPLISNTSSATVEGDSERLSAQATPQTDQAPPQVGGPSLHFFLVQSSDLSLVQSSDFRDLSGTFLGCARGSSALSTESEHQIFTALAVYRAICSGDPAAQEAQCAYLLAYYQVHIAKRNHSIKFKMRCNACWQELEGRAVVTTCGHLLCTEDASKILSNDGGCPVCDQVLPKSQMKPVDINPNDEWVNVSKMFLKHSTVMKSTFKSVMFYIGQKELEMQFKLSRLAAQYRQKFEATQEKFNEKLEQVYAAYQKAAKRCQMMEQENERLRKDKAELQEKFSEQSRQKRKLEDMYDQLKREYESVKRSAIQPASNFYARNDADLFSNPAATMMDTREPLRNDWSDITPRTPGPREDVWFPRQNPGTSGFGISGGSRPRSGSPANTAAKLDLGNRSVAGGNAGFGVAQSKPAMKLKNLIFSPIKRPQMSRNHSNLFSP
ncbi:unnamed protein product [Linum tenue]|uniref:RING-type domain-containing protein n=1 Tax=Linum tenue TaxID=586396 RepID=A0AAV0N4N7_9ROSI|nr:unnamed protein product [Linum tenue]